MYIYSEKPDDTISYVKIAFNFELGALEINV